jgi:hypothetical protein
MHLTQVTPRSCGCPQAKSRNNVRVLRLALILEAFQRPIGPGVTIFRVPRVRRPRWTGGGRQRTFRKRVTDCRDRNRWWLPESSAYPLCPFNGTNSTSRRLLQAESGCLLRSAYPVLPLATATGSVMLAEPRSEQQNPGHHEPEHGGQQTQILWQAKIHRVGARRKLRRAPRR